MNVEDASFLDEVGKDAWRPDPLQTVAEWSDAHMVLPSWAAEPGRWRTSRTPYLKEIMECLSPLHPCRRVVFMKCAQIGGTSCGANWIGYTVHRVPRAMLIVEPTVDVAKKLSKQKLQPMFDSVPALKGLIRDTHARESGNTILAKEFLGGMMVLTGANSGVGLRFMAAQNLFLDEVDAYPYDVDGEGTPVALAEKRTLTYARHKVYLCSTPLIKATSVIEPEYEASDQRRYFVACPHCRHPQHLRWGQLTWPNGKPEAAKYKCEACTKLIAEHHKTSMLEAGEWRAEFPERSTAGFHLNALYAPYGWVNSWAYLATEWTRIIHKRDLLQQQTFTNTNLAETWEETGEKLNTRVLSSRREVYGASVPDGVLVLTGAADIQDDRIEVECVGWGEGEESWSIDYRCFHGSPGQPDVWKELDAWRQLSWTTASGMAMKIIQLAIDTGGHHAKEAYEFIKTRERERVCALKGSAMGSHPLVGRPTTSNFGKVLLYPVGTDTAKDSMFSRLKLETFGPGYCHFPMVPAYDEEYFAQLTSEEKRNKYDKGVLQGTYYKKIRARNEALDLKVYNMVALAILNPSFTALAARLVPSPTTTPPPPPPQETAVPPRRPFVRQSTRRGGGFTSGWR
jgi:phage terminase large subunit GpA-like protein